jgi:hypothetical protein
MIIATDAAIQTAIRNEARMTGYTVEEFSHVPGSFYVSKDKGPMYVVTIRAGVENCTCPYFEENGICKHYVRCEKDALLEAEAAERERYEI